MSALQSLISAKGYEDLEYLRPYRPRDVRISEHAGHRGFHSAVEEADASALEFQNHLVSVVERESESFTPIPLRCSNVR
jgi:hypothetical protein